MDIINGKYTDLQSQALPLQCWPANMRAATSPAYSVFGTR